MAEQDFELFFKKHQNTIFRIVRGYVRQKDTAEDIVLETMAVIHARWDRVKTFENPAGYAVRVAINRAKRHLLARKVGSWLSFHEPENSPEVGSPAGNPESAVLKKEEEEWLTRELGALRDMERVVILIKDIDRKKFEEVAEILEMKLPTVKSIYRRAKMKLARRWEEAHGQTVEL